MDNNAEEFNRGNMFNVQAVNATLNVIKLFLFFEQNKIKFVFSIFKDSLLARNNMSTFVNSLV